MMKCMVCRSEKEVKHLGNIYTIGSEGTDLCIDCRIATSNFIRQLQNVASRAKAFPVKVVKR